MNAWVKCMVGYLLVASIVIQMLPNRKYMQYIRLFNGFLLILLVLQPVLRIGNIDSYLETEILAFVEEQETLEEKIIEEGNRFREENEVVLSQEQDRIRIQEIEKVRVEVKNSD